MANIQDGSPAPCETGRQEPKLVTFSGMNDPSNPREWAMRKKWLTMIIVSLFGSLPPIASTMIAPALPEIGNDIGATGGEASRTLLLSIFLLGYVIGPLLSSPLSEMYGRAPILQLGNMVFLVFDLACGFADTYSQMLVFRLFAGVGASTPLGIGGGIISDCFKPEQRGLAQSVYNLFPLLGPAIGPIIGAFITEYSDWRWMFWATCIAGAVIQGMAFFLLDETWALRILEKRKQALIKQTGQGYFYTAADVDDEDKSIMARLRTALTRPLRLLATEAVVQALCLYMAFLYGVTFLVLSTFGSLWAQEYGFSPGIGSLNYLSLALGYTLATQVSARLNDRIYTLMNHKTGREIPEHRLPMLVIGALLMPCGLIIYAWTAQYRCHWIAVDIGALIYAAGTFTCFQCLQIYLIDTYTTYAASALAAATILRSIFGTCFPLFAPSLYEALGYGWGTTTLALLAVVIGWLTPPALWKYGPSLRARRSHEAAQAEGMVQSDVSEEIGAGR